MIPSDMRRIADLCGVEIHKYSMTPGTIHVTLYPAPQATVRLFVECMDEAMPSSMQTVVSYTSGAPTAAQGRPHDTSCTCETCNPPAVLTLDELRLREAQATPTRAAAFASAAARANGAELADTCGTLTTQNTELLAENARLRRELERGKPKPKPVDRTTAWQPTPATGLIPRRGR